MQLRAYRPEDCAAMAALFYDTVHTVNRRDYSPAQLDAWATGEVNLAQWNDRFLTSRTLVAEEVGVLLGFGNMDVTGYLDMLYVHKDHQRRGVARALCDALEDGSQATRFSTHASITARPFFEHRGYQTLRAQQVEREGIQLTNYVMEKERNTDNKRTDAFGTYRPLLLRAALAGQMGRIEICSGVRIIDGEFVYLDGLPNDAALTALTERWSDRLFVPLYAPERWERALCGLGRPVGRTKRYQMQEMPPERAAQTPSCPVPAGYELRPFDAEAFARRPFGHGRWYRDAAHFAAEGVGAVAWKDGEIVASASSYLTFGGHVELDVSTLDAHRRLGLARACCAEMLRQCGERGLTVHWDAQHEVSRHLAETLGFELLTPYVAYSFMDVE